MNQKKNKSIKIKTHQPTPTINQKKTSNQQIEARLTPRNTTTSSRQPPPCTPSSLSSPSPSPHLLLKGFDVIGAFVIEAYFPVNDWGIYGYKEKWDKERGILEESFVIEAQEWNRERKAETWEALVLLSERREKKKWKICFYTIQR